MRDVLDGAILVFVPVVHFLEDVTLVLFKFTKRISLDLRDLVSLPLQLSVQLFDQLALLLKPLFLLGDDRFLNFLRLLRQIFQDFAFFLHSCILLSFQVDKIFVHLVIDWSQLVIQTLNTIASLLCEHVFELGHAIVATSIFTLLVFVLSIEFVFHLCVQIFQLLIIPDLVCLQRVVYFLALINCILLDVLDFPKWQKKMINIC